MIKSLELKPDLARTIDRLEAWWLGEIVDRPPVSIGIPPTAPVDLPRKQHASLREQWLDVEYHVERGLAGLKSRTFVGDDIPAWMPNVGPELTSTLWNCELEFGKNTSWSIPFIESPDQFRQIAEQPPNFDNVYWQTIERMTDLALERFAGVAMVSIADLHGNMDILAGLRDPQLLCMDLIDDPEPVIAAQMNVARGYGEAFGRLYDKVAATGQGSLTWTRFYHEGPAYIPSSDFWCMLSDEMARDVVLPAIRQEMQPIERSIFHLDGPQALRHLDLLLEMDDLDAVQWVYGAGNGPASRHIDVYRRCLDAGKSVQVACEGGEDGLAVLEALGPRGVWLTGVGCGSVDEAEAYLQQVERLTRAAG